VGAYPNASDMVRFKGFEDDQTLCSYVPFNNIWGLRNFSRARALKKAVQDFIRAEDDQKLILAYCTHTPFIEAAIYAKKKDPRIKVCLYVPDLPNYMNLSANRSWLYDVAKVYDVAVMTRLMKQVDSFVLLTEHVPPSVHKLFELVNPLVIAAIGVVVAGWSAVLLADGWNVKIAGAPMPQSINFLPLCVGGALMVLFALHRLVLALGQPAGKREGR
jgi:hypothetical protein